MVSPRELLHLVESTLLTDPSPHSPQRMNFLNTIQNSSSLFKELLSFEPPRSSDRSEMQSGEVKLSDSSRITVDDQDIRIASKLSDDLHLNEIDCVRLLVSANQEWGLMGRDPLEIFRLSAGLWYTERRDTITSIHTMLKAVVLGNGDSDFISDIQKYLEDLLNSGLQQRFIRLIKELNREEPAGLGGPSCEQYVIDSRGTLVERRAVICQERLILCHCLVFSLLIIRISPNDMKDVFYILKDSASELSRHINIVKQQITFSLLFTIVVAFISDALGATFGRDASSRDKKSMLSFDTSFRREFQNIVMSTESDPFVDGFVGGVRLAWCVHLTLVHNEMSTKDIGSNVLPYKELITSCLDTILVKNTFHFLLSKVLTTAAYQNEDEDMIYIYDAYLHKLITCFLSHDLTRDKVKEMKDKAMSDLSPYHVAGVHDMLTNDYTLNSQGETEPGPQPFVSLLEFVKQIYEKEPKLLSDNDDLWNFVIFAGEDHHTNVETLVAFLKLLSTLASSQEGACRVFELLDGKTFKSVGWKALFGCLSVYEGRFRQCIQTKGAALPDFQEGDAKALVAYLDILQKVVEHRSPAERENCFPDIEPLFKLLNYENVPPELKAALRSCIAVFAKISPALRDKIWSYLEIYDLPVVVNPQVRTIGQPFGSQVYDMHYELNEIEAKREQYSSTISFINLLNILISEETDLSDRGNRFIGIFRFICDQVFGLFLHRAYAVPSEKWQLAVACLQHFHMILSMYEITDEDIDTVVGQSQFSLASQLERQIPVVELLKDFMSGKTVIRNMMAILSPGVSSIVTQRTSELHGLYLEKAVHLCLEILILVFEKDILVSDFWRPFYQPLDVILAQDCNHIVTLLEYVRYDYLVQIQRSSVRIMRILSARMAGLVQLLLKSNAANALVEDYAACLQLRSEESQLTRSINEDIGVLILQVLIDNVGRPAPNVSHLLLKFDLDGRIERTTLNPKFHYSCLKIILDMLNNLLKPEVNSFLYELYFQLLYELCLDPLTSGPIMDLLNNKTHQFFVKHLDSIGISPLPKRNDQALRISSLHQRAWFLKLLAVGLHVGDMSMYVEREACHAILEYLLGHDASSPQTVSRSSSPQYSVEKSVSWSAKKSRVMKLLEVVLFKAPDVMKHFEVASSKFNSLVNDILANSATSEKGGVYYFSDRGDRLIDLTSFRDMLSQKLTLPQLGSPGIEAQLNDVKEAIKGLLKWGWNYNKNLEEQAAQLHMLTGWSQVVEVAASRRLSSLENQSDILLELLESSLTASASSDCSLKMALILTQVTATCMAKLRDERFVFPGGVCPDNITCMDILMGKQFPNSSCQSVLLKLVTALLRQESSEPLRRRQYALLLSYFQFCQHILNLDVPETVLQVVFLSEQHGEEQNIIKIDREQADLMKTNFIIIRKEAQAIFDLIVKDATKGSETGKTISLYVLDALIAIDHEKFFLNQIQSRGVLRLCLMEIGSLSNLDSGFNPQDNLQRALTLQAELALLLRICVRYGRSGSQILSSMRVLEHISSCKAVSFQAISSLSEVKIRKHGADIDKAQMVVVPILRLVFALTSLIDTSDYFDVKNKIVRETMSFVKGRQYFFDQILHQNTSTADEATMEQLYLVVAILTKVWPYEENDEYGLLQGILSMARNQFSGDFEALSFSCSGQSLQNQRNFGMYIYQICFCLSSYIHFLVSRKSFKFEVLTSSPGGHAQASSKQLTLQLLGHFVSTVTVALEKSNEERSLLLNKIQGVNELSRQEVDEIITVCERQDYILLSDNMQKRRYVAMVEMCRGVGGRDHVISLLLPITENLLNVILLHFQDSPIVPSEAATRLITHENGIADDKQKTGLFYGNLISTLERLESLCEMLGKMGKDVKLMQRLVVSVKEMALQRLTF